MAFKKGRRRSYGGEADTGAGWEPKVDKNPYYRTTDIFNGIFKKNIKLRRGKENSTDGKVITVNFGETKPSKIAELLGPGKGQDQGLFLLECGHEWEGKALKEDGSPKQPGVDFGACWTCGAAQSYLGFEHEWQHIIFKSDLVARKMFVDKYIDELMLKTPNINEDALEEFLHLFVNAFDDLRVNSLWELVYPGSAAAIWERWHYLTKRMGDEINKSFMPFVFSVAFGVPTNSSCEFENLRPIIKQGVDRVKYRDFTNMLIDVRVVIEGCINTILAKIPAPQMMPPPPPSSTNIPQQQQQGGDPNGQQGGQGPGAGEDGDGDGQAQLPGQAGSPAPQGGQEPQGNSPGMGVQPAGTPPQAPPVPQNSGAHQPGDLPAPSPNAGSGGGQERTNALEKLMGGAREIDKKEKHEEPTDEDLAAGMKSQSLQAMVNKALSADISDPNVLDQQMPIGVPDPGMQQQLNQLQKVADAKSESSQLTSNAKANVLIIEVTPSGRPNHKAIELSDEEDQAVVRMRAAFFKAMGKKKMVRSMAGNTVDTQAFIQYLINEQDPLVFENEDAKRGFCYSVLCDMSGSMSSIYPHVCHAVEMLKDALDFPFVQGHMWGFRGGQDIGHNGQRRSRDGEVWMYRYSKDVHWYTGTQPMRFWQGPTGQLTVPVECGGITPMNSAINVSVAHLEREPAGMAKRLFLLTDGSPIQVKTTGSTLPDFMLRQFVANEIRKARKQGIQVYTIVIGNHSIPEEHCLAMFGPRRFWRRAEDGKVATALASIVLANFQKYLTAR